MFISIRVTESVLCTKQNTNVDNSFFKQSCSRFMDFIGLAVKKKITSDVPLIEFQFLKILTVNNVICY